jgi:hypothetical protein
LGEKIKKGKDDAILSKKLANHYHVSSCGNFMKKIFDQEWNKRSIEGSFIMNWNLKPLVRDCLEMNLKLGATRKPAEGIQTDLFGNSCRNH